VVVVGATEITVDVIVLNEIVVVTATSALVTAVVLGIADETLVVVFASCRACRAFFPTACCPAWPNASSGRPASSSAARSGSIM
jgi:hypothetical protein